MYTILMDLIWSEIALQFLMKINTLNLLYEVDIALYQEVVSPPGYSATWVVVGAFTR